MKAIVLDRFGGPEVMELREVPEPAPGPGQVLLKVGACAVCYLDTIVRSGMRSRARLPLIPGHEFSGQVVATGPGVRGVAVGDRVASVIRVACGRCLNCLRGRDHLCWNMAGQFGIEFPGAYAEYLVVPEHCLAKIPPEIGYEGAAFFACVIGTVLHAVRKMARVEPGEQVLVTGAGGGLGVHAIQMAKLAGARVLAVTSSPDKVERIKGVGADEVILSPDLEFSREVRRLTDGRGVDVVIENVGSAIFQSSFKSLADGGRLVFTGELSGSPIEVNPALVLLKEISLVGSRNTTLSELMEVVDLVRWGKIRPVVSESLPLGEARRAHELLRDRRSFGRVVLVP